jgi:hypothetical protein
MPRHRYLSHKCHQLRLRVNLTPDDSVGPLRPRKCRRTVDGLCNVCLPFCSRWPSANLAVSAPDVHCAIRPLSSSPPTSRELGIRIIADLSTDMCRYKYNESDVNGVTLIVPGAERRVVDPRDIVLHRREGDLQFIHSPPRLGDRGKTTWYLTSSSYT